MRVNLSQWFRLLGIIVAALVFILWPIENAAGLDSHSTDQQNEQVTPAQLIEAVNNLRIANGLHALSFHPILQQTAQQQANALLASKGAVGHTRPGGISYTDQLMMLGYPLGGDLTQGGYRAENWTSLQSGMTVDDAIQMWLGDGPHTNTMLSPYYEDIGAGVAYASDGSSYLVIDTAMPTASGQPQDYTPAVPGQPGVQGTPDLSDYVQPIIIATARPDGDVIHEVRYGQSLWSIAITYGTKIEAIRLLNNLADNTIYTGQLLLISKGATQPAPESATQLTELSGTASRTPHPTRTRTQTPATQNAAATSTVAEDSPAELDKSQAGFSKTGMIVGLLLTAAIIGGAVMWSAVKIEK